MSTKPSIKVLKLILREFDREPKMLCVVVTKLFIEGKVKEDQLHAARHYFHYLLEGCSSLEHWLACQGLKVATYFNPTPETHAHRRAWLVKMINGEI